MDEKNEVNIEPVSQWDTQQGEARRAGAKRRRMEEIATVAEAALRARFPAIQEVRLSFGTTEGEDGYLWVTIPPGNAELRRRVLAAAAAETARYLDEGIGILPQIRFAPAA